MRPQPRLVPATPRILRVDSRHWPHRANGRPELRDFHCAILTIRRVAASEASVLKSEISRVARKALRAETEGLKKAVAGCRSEIAALKRRSQALEQELGSLRRAIPKVPPAAVADGAEPHTLRFSAKGLASQRARLGLSAEDCGLLVGTSGQSVYNWEAGKARPRAKYLPTVAALRTMGKKEAVARLASLRASTT